MHPYKVTKDLFPEKGEGEKKKRSKRRNKNTFQIPSPIHSLFKISSLEPPPNDFLPPSRGRCTAHEQATISKNGSVPHFRVTSLLYILKELNNTNQVS